MKEKYFLIHNRHEQGAWVDARTEDIDDIYGDFEVLGCFDSEEEAWEHYRKLDEETSSWGIFINEAAGKCYIARQSMFEWETKKFYNCYGEFETREEAEKELEMLIEKTTCWVLFVNNIDGDAFVEEWKLGMGPYQQRRPYTAMGVFNSEQEAINALEDLKKEE